MIEEIGGGNHLFIYTSANWLTLKSDASMQNY